MNCPQPNGLVDIWTTLGSDSEKTLSHALECDACLAALRTLASVRSIAAPHEDVRPGFIREVLRALPHSSPARAPTRERWSASRIGWFVLEPLLAAAAALVATAAASTAAPVPLGVPAVVVAIAAGVVVAATSRALQTGVSAT